MDWNLDVSFERMINDFIAWIPHLIGAIFILVVGYVVAKLLEKGTDAVLEKVGFDRAASRGGVADALARTGTRMDPSSAVASLVFWVVLLVVILMAANALGLTAIAAMFEELVTYIPNVIVAILILVFAMMLGEFVKDLTLATVGRVEGARMLANLAKVSIIVLAIFMALDQLQIADDIVETAFTLLLGALALAVALAFGLGNRELAAEYTRRWVERGEQKAREMKGEADKEAPPHKSWDHQPD